MDIDKWKIQACSDYPFLEEIWDIYNSYIVNENKSEYDEILSYCDKSPLLRSDTTGKYIKFCKNLSRNLLLLADCDYTGEKFNKYCDILYMWMYFEINRNGIPNNITEQLFNASTQVVTTKRYKTPCHYFNFNEKYYEPTKLMKLRIFEKNTSIFTNNLYDIKELNYCSCLKYVYECVNIYREMHKDFCLGKNNLNLLIKILVNFKTSYLAYLFDARGIKDKLPPLDGTKNEHFPRCLSDESKLGSAEDLVQDAEANSPGAEQSKSRISLSTLAIVSTMVGIPPFLALIYKFNPVGRIFRTKNKSINIFNNLDNEIEKELFYPSHKNAITNSNLETYNVAY
ncbi:VIR protein [Plasmodium vivax]|uniref:VIR protein n=1 Tax=Plasmodium vivax TaxID=5855 RepID=A0A1G4EDR6_PLAVI|nr:VIR protein [Plasmodium vivax]